MALANLLPLALGVKNMVSGILGAGTAAAPAQRQASLIDQIQAAQNAARRGEGAGLDIFGTKTPEQVAAEEREARLNAPLTAEEQKWADKIRQLQSGETEGALSDGMRWYDYVPAQYLTPEFGQRAGISGLGVSGLQGRSRIQAVMAESAKFGGDGRTVGAGGATEGSGSLAVPSRTDPATVMQLSREQLLRHLRDQEMRGRQSTLMGAGAGLTGSMPAIGRPAATRG